MLTEVPQAEVQEHTEVAQQLPEGLSVQMLFQETEITEPAEVPDLFPTIAAQEHIALMALRLPLGAVEPIEVAVIQTETLQDIGLLRAEAPEVINLLEERHQEAATIEDPQAVPEVLEVTEVDHQEVPVAEAIVDLPVVLEAQEAIEVQEAQVGHRDLDHHLPEEVEDAKSKLKIHIN